MPRDSNIIERFKSMSNADKDDDGSIDVVKQPEGEAPEAEELDDGITLSPEDENVDGDDGGEAEGEDAGGGEAEGEDDNVDVVRASLEGSQPKKQGKKPIGVIKRINKLNAKVKQAESGQTEAEKALALQQEENKLLRTLVKDHRDKPKTPARPKIDDFDLGVDDPAYQTALETFQDHVIDQKVEAKLAKSTEQIDQTLTVNENAKALEAKQTDHYTRASELGAKDFEETEDKAIEVLGEGVINTIIENFEKDSHIMTYYLGKDANRAEAQNIANLLSDSRTLVKGVAELGALQRDLKVVQSGKPAPNPDNELGGAEVPNTRTKDDDGPAGASYV